MAASSASERKLTPASSTTACASRGTIPWMEEAAGNSSSMPTWASRMMGSNVQRRSAPSPFSFPSNCSSKLPSVVVKTEAAGAIEAYRPSWSSVEKAQGRWGATLMREASSPTRASTPPPNPRISQGEFRAANIVGEAPGDDLRRAAVVHIPVFSTPIEAGHWLGGSTAVGDIVGRRRLEDGKSHGSRGEYT